MSNKAYSILQIVGTSAKSIEDAINCAIQSAQQQTEKLNWFQVLEMRGLIDKDKVAYYPVKLEVGCNS